VNPQQILTFNPLLVCSPPHTKILSELKELLETHLEMRYPNLTSLYFVAFNAPDGGSLWDDLRKIFLRMAKVQNGEEILPKASTPE